MCVCVCEEKMNDVNVYIKYFVWLHEWRWRGRRLDDDRRFIKVKATITNFPYMCVCARIVCSFILKFNIIMNNGWDEAY